MRFQYLRVIAQRQCGNTGKAVKNAEKLVERNPENRWFQKELTETYIGLIKMNRDGTESHFKEIMDGLCRMLEQYGVYMKEYIPDILMIVSYASTDERNGREEHGRIRQTVELLRGLCSSDQEKNAIDSAMDEMIYQRIRNDPRIGDTLIRAYEAYYNLDDMDAQVRKYALTDVQLCMVEERQDVLKQAEIIRQDYPEYYERLYDFIRRLQSEKNLIYLKDSLLNLYNRMDQECSGGYYYEKYPREKIKLQGTRISDGMDQPYVRSERKIGRNEPCPCGSGKKYKHCCMNKQTG